MLQTPEGQVREVASCGFTHKADPSKGDPEVQRRIAEKKAKESFVLSGDRLKVMLAPVEGATEHPQCVERWQALCTARF